MTVQEVLDQLDGLDGDERATVLGPLIAQLSPVSKRTLHSFQAGWDSTRSWAEFKEAQNQVFRDCVKMEMSPVGQEVRELLGLPPLAAASMLAERARRKEQGR